jgi:hypothetical protein
LLPSCLALVAVAIAPLAAAHVGTPTGAWDTFECGGAAPGQTTCTTGVHTIMGGWNTPCFGGLSSSFSGVVISRWTTGPILWQETRCIYSNGAFSGIRTWYPWESLLPWSSTPPQGVPFTHTCDADAVPSTQVADWACKMSHG